MFRAKWRCSVCGRGFFGNGDEMIVRRAGDVKIMWGIQNHHSNVNILLPKHCKFRTENRGPQTLGSSTSRNINNFSGHHMTNQKERYNFETVEITNKMPPCNRIYYSKIYWRLNMFRAAHRSSSGAPNCICSLNNGRSPHVYTNQRLQIQFGAPDDERCAARNMLSLQ
jgi:hypothetical protein